MDDHASKPPHARRGGPDGAPFRTGRDPDKLTEAELNLCLERMHFAFRRLVEGPNSILSDLGLGRAHHRALFFVRRDGLLPVGALAAILGISIQALHRVIGDLLRQDLMRSVPDESDRRIRNLSLTPKGKRLESRLSGAQRKMFAKVATKLGRGEIESWSAVMEELRAGPKAGVARTVRKE